MPKNAQEWLDAVSPPPKTRGIFKLFLGYAPGVGKTFNMLSEALRRKSRDEDVIIGVVETHGRKGIAELAQSLEAVPRKKIEYKGTVFEEMDVDAILARRPAVVLVDELAHTNIPGSKYRKRYEDVQALLAAGIDVMSTLNIQHIESIAPTEVSLVGPSGTRTMQPTWGPSTAPRVRQQRTASQRPQTPPAPGAQDQATQGNGAPPSGAPPRQATRANRATAAQNSPDAPRDAPMTPARAARPSQRP